MSGEAVRRLRWSFFVRDIRGDAAACALTKGYVGGVREVAFAKNTKFIRRYSIKIIAHIKTINMGKVFRTLRNVDKLTDSLMTVGRLFQVIGPATLKAF